MSEATQIAVREPNEIRLGTLQANTPEELLTAAASVAKPLAGMIAQMELFNNIQGKRYVRCEGWTTMGAMLGIVPREVSNGDTGGGVYVATVELVNIRTGEIVGRASAECGGIEDPVWGSRQPYARRSMAATRATSKAFRLSFSWIMTLAGYEATPAEEMHAEGGSENSALRAAAKASDHPRIDVGGWIVPYGNNKGKTAADLDNKDLKWWIERLSSDITDAAKATYKTRNKSALDICLNEINRRAANASAPVDETNIPF